MKCKNARSSEKNTKSGPVSAFQLTTVHSACHVVFVSTDHVASTGHNVQWKKSRNIWRYLRIQSRR